MDDLNRTYVDIATRFKMPGWSRGAWYTTLGRGSRWSKTRFLFVVHQKGECVRVEIFRVVGGTCSLNIDAKPIPANVIREFAICAGLEGDLLEVDGHLFIEDKLDSPISKLPSRELCEATKACCAISKHGNHLAEMLNWDGKVATASAAKEVSECLSSIERFVDEMEPDGCLNKRIADYRAKIDTQFARINNIDAKCRETMEILSLSREYLGSLGIDCDSSKKEME